MGRRLGIVDEPLDFGLQSAFRGEKRRSQPVAP
jgi:hypothetical protein